MGRAVDQLSAIVWKDVVTELRTKELFSSMFTFSLIILAIFNIAFGFSSELIPAAAPAILWIAFTFAGVLGLGRSFSIEHEGNAITGLLLTPVDRSVVFLGKVASNSIFVLLVELILIPVFVLFFNLNLFEVLLPLLAILALGTIGFVSVGTLFSAMVANTRLREVLLPIMLFPIILPLLISSVKLTESVIAGEGIMGAGGSIHILVAFDVIFLAVCSVVFEYVIED